MKLTVEYPNGTVYVNEVDSKPKAMNFLQRMRHPNFEGTVVTAITSFSGLFMWKILFIKTKTGKIRFKRIYPAAQVYFLRPDVIL